jgi:uncharacterized membrane protein
LERIALRAGAIVAASGEGPTQKGRAMADEDVTYENVIAVSFPQEANAYEALARLKELDAQGAIEVLGAAVVVREEDGQITVKDQFGKESVEDTATGTLLGLLVGVLGGPFGILVGGLSGLLVGSLFDEDEDDHTKSVLGDISSNIRVGPPGLLADVSEEDQTAIDAVMAHLDGTIVRRKASDVELELAAAEDAQREAKKKARKELREARHKKHQEDVDAKVAELKAKLPSHKKVTQKV